MTVSVQTRTHTRTAWADPIGHRWACDRLTSQPSAACQCIYGVVPPLSCCDTPPHRAHSTIASPQALPYGLSDAERHLCINISHFPGDAADDLFRVIAGHKDSRRTAWIPGGGTRRNLKLEGLTWNRVLVFCAAYDSKCAPHSRRPGFRPLMDGMRCMGHADRAPAANSMHTGGVCESGCAVSVYVCCSFPQRTRFLCDLALSCFAYARRGRLRSTR